MNTDRLTALIGKRIRVWSLQGRGMTLLAEGKAIAHSGGQPVIFIEQHCECGRPIHTAHIASLPIDYEHIEWRDSSGVGQ